MVSPLNLPLLRDPTLLTWEHLFVLKHAIRGALGPKREDHKALGHLLERIERAPSPILEELARPPLLLIGDLLQTRAQDFVTLVEGGRINAMGTLSPILRRTREAFLQGATASFPDAPQESPLFLRYVATNWGAWLRPVQEMDEKPLLLHSRRMGDWGYFEEGPEIIPEALDQISKTIGRLALREMRVARLFEGNRGSLVNLCVSLGRSSIVGEMEEAFLGPAGITTQFDTAVRTLHEAGRDEEAEYLAALERNRMTLASRVIHAGDFDLLEELIEGLSGPTGLLDRIEGTVALLKEQGEGDAAAMVADHRDLLLYAALTSNSTDLPALMRMAQRSRERTGGSYDVPAKSA